MTQEEKELLLKDLGTRLAYHPVIYGKEGIATNEGILTSVTTSGIGINTKGGSVYFYFMEQMKPYLLPMSRMTEDEHNDWCQYYHNAEMEELNKSGDYFKAAMSGDNAKYDWLNAHHFDYRGLIEKGLALEAPKGMYNTKGE